MELSSTYNAESMIKQNALVHFVTYLHTFLNEEPARSTFHIILDISVHI